MEKRIFTFNAEIRSSGEDKPEIMGRGAVVGSVTDLGWFEEEIAADAFREADLSDVCVCFNHDLSVILGRNSAGTADIEVDEDGNLMYHAHDVDMENPSVKSAVRYIQRGEVNKSSFMFEIKEEGWGDSEKYGKYGKRTIYKVGKVYEAGPVTFPAYDDTDAGARSAVVQSRDKWVKANATPTEHMIDDNAGRDLDIVSIAVERYKNY